MFKYCILTPHACENSATKAEKACRGGVQVKKNGGYNKKSIP